MVRDETISYFSVGATSRIVAANQEEQGRGWGFYVEMVLVALGILAVAAWLGALVYVIVT